MKRSTDFCFAVIAVCVVFNTWASSQTRKRDLTEYKQAPLFDLKNDYFPQRNQERALVRKHVWELWTTHTKGFINVIFYTREGAPSKCTFFVEPNSQRAWRVVSECKHSVCPYSSAKRCDSYLKTVFRTNYDVVTRVAYETLNIGASGPRRRQIQIGDSENRDPVGFILILKESTSGRKHEL